MEIMRYASIKKLLTDPYNDPFTAFSITVDDVLQCKRKREYVKECKRRQGYHCGRIQYFLKKLENKENIEPIVVNRKNNVCNGFHRLAAYIIAGRKRICVIDIDESDDGIYDDEE